MNLIMDVFGTVISSIQLVNKLIGYLQAVRKANEDCLGLLSEVSALGTLLDALRCRLGKGSTDSNDGVSDQLVKVGIKGPLDQCCRAMEPIVAELERTALKTNTGKPSLLAENMRRFRWPFRQGEIGAILGGIERLKSLISLALQTSLIEFIDKARNELAVVGLNVEKIGAAVSALEADQRVHTKKAESLHINLRALGFELQDAAEGISNIGNMVATIDRNQQDQMMKGNLMQADLTVVKEAMYGQELQEALRWLSPLDFSGKHSTAFGKRAPGTEEWFLEHPTFAAWRRGEASVLWCPGNPGVGKSVMAPIVTHRLREQISEDAAVVSVYFEYTTKYTAQIAEVILKQLMRRRITQSGINSLRRHMAADRPTVEELWTILEAEVRTYARVFIVIDALDEADIQVWAPLLERLRSLSGISLLATSRNTGKVEFGLRPYQRLDIMANEGDMGKYIDGRLLDSTGTLKRLLKENAPLREEIIAGIMKKADGMFLLAQLHMNSLEKKARVTDLRQALTRLPGDLKNTYDDTLGRISDEDKPLAYQIFSWLIHATRPMTIHDLQYALAVKEGMAAIDADDLYDEGHLTSICVGLVVLQDSENTSPHSRGAPVGLVHYTTQEYLRDYLSPHLPHPTHLAITCLQYFSFDIFRIKRPLSRDPEEPLTQMPLAEYAIYSWGEHARMYCDDKTIQDLAMELLRDPPRVVTIGSLPCGAIDLSAIHLCAHFGLKRYLEYVLDDGFDLNSKDSNGDTAITYAARNGWEEIARLLLGREGIDIDPKGRNGATPLIQAAMDGHQGIVVLLLARDDVGGNWRERPVKRKWAAKKKWIGQGK